MGPTKIFTTSSIVSVAGIAIVAVACSSSSTGDSGNGGTSSSGGSSGTALVDGGGGGGAGGKCEGAGTITVAASTGGGGDGGGGDAGACPANSPLSSADLDKAIGWKCPSGKKGSCTNDEIAAIEKNLDDPNVKSYFDIAKDASEACKSCVVSKDSDSAWAPIVGFSATNGETGLLNYGACFGFLIGASCGRSVQYLELCLAQACDDCATTQAERKACVEGASAGVCKGFVDSLSKECPLLANAEPQCSDIIVAMKTICGPE